ncbi:LPS assembly lipoprotein LptE [Candidatus Vallotia cooleyia]|uniref:LPS-assembly lipoprotein LptE n=1 Tax=Candidatus Vallotiella adelgis TaxID=1177211 RepID=UPI001D0276EA|nr:LPS assembly lipoprotein LptE [Candidatus Vallotia cooleyia]
MSQFYIELTAAVLLLSGCGFQLRSDYEIPLKRLALVVQSSELNAQIQRMIKGGSQTKIVTIADSPDAIFSISESRSTKVLILNAIKRINEYELNYTISYKLVSVDGTVLLPPNAIQINRSVIYSDQYTALAKSQEFDMLYRNMRNLALDQLLRRISAVCELHLTDSKDSCDTALRTPATRCTTRCSYA